MTSDVSIKLSISAFVGLLIVGTLSAVVFAMSVVLMHPAVDGGSGAVVQAKPGYEPTVSAVPLPVVNELARDEVKQGIFGRRIVVNPVCVDCSQPSPLPSVLVKPAVTPASPQPTPAPSLPSRLRDGDKPSQESARYEITLFLGNDAKSQELAGWFKTNPTLVEWRNSCSYQEYTADSPLYQNLKNREGVALRDVVPPNQFPAVVFANPGGGHIHAAGGNALPSSPEQLIDDVRKANELSREVVMQNSGLVRTAGYKWDSTVHPAMRLSAEDCIDGNCLDKPESGWVPGKVIKDVFGTTAKQSVVRDALWGWLDVLVAGAVAVVVVTAFCVLFVVVVVLFFVNRK